MPKRELEKQENSTAHSLKKRSDPITQLKNKFEAITTFYVFYNANSTAAVTLSSLQQVVPDVTLQDLAAINVVLPDFIRFEYVTRETIEIEFGYPSGVNNKNTLKPAKIKQLISQQIKLFNKALADFLKMCKQKQLDASDYLLRELEKYMPYPILDDDFDDDDDDCCEPESQKSLTDVIEGLKHVSFYDGQFETVKSFDAEEPVYGGELDLLSSEIKLALGVEKLYVHQTEALQALFDGQHVIVSTSTARYV